MKKMLTLLTAAACSMVFAAEAANSPAAEAAKPVNETVIELKKHPTRTHINLAPVDCPEGKIAVLKVELFYKNNSASGWNPTTQLFINNQLLDDQTADGSKRLLRTHDSFLTTFSKDRAKYFNSKSKGWYVFFSPGNGVIDKRVTDGAAEYKCVYFFDVSDIITDTKAATNKLTIHCALQLSHTKNRQYPLMVRDYSIVPMSEEEVAKLRGE